MAKLTIRFSRPPGTAASVFAMARVEGMKSMLAHWQSHYVPMHFNKDAGKRYSYQPRKGDDEPAKIPRADGKPGTRNNPHYSWVKRRKKHHNNPLVWSGDSQKIATNPANFTIAQMSSNRVRGQFTGLSAYWFKFHKAGVYKRWHMHGGLQFINMDPQPNKAEELVRVIQSEVDEIARVGEARIVSFINAYQMPTSVSA